MKKLFTLLLIANIFVVNGIKAQNLPIAVNDTFYVNFSDTARTCIFLRSIIIPNDTLGSGTQRIIDTITYNGVNQAIGIYYSGGATFLRVKEVRFTTNPGFFGKDSITYYLTDNGVPTGIDTATIYIYVKRKAYENIDLNNINASVHKDILFHDPINQIAAFNAPKQNNAFDPFCTTIFAANFWFAGLDNNGQLKGYTETFASNSTPPTQYSNFTGGAGPVMNISNYEKYSYKWDRVWKVTAIDIQNHIAGNGTTEAILNWPAHGDVTKGQSQNLAPFYDYNGDGNYNPTQGDYPKIKGQQAIFFIRNSDRVDNEMLTINNNLEFHGMVYAYDCPEDSSINNTVFIDYTIYNRSTSNLTDCYFGQWVDFDLGNSGDDYVGCDVSRGTFYAYNGDNNDENANGVEGYGTVPPAQGVIFLKGAKQENDGADNPLTTNITTAIAQNGIPYTGLGIGFGDGITDNEYFGLSHFMYYSIGNGAFLGDGDPQNEKDYYNYLKGHWRDSSQVVWGGNGYPPQGSNVATNYLFPGDSDPLFWSTQGVPVTPTTWSENSVGNTPGDRRGMGSTGPFTLLAGESAQMELAFVFGRDYNGTDNMASLVVMQERVDSIRSYHANGFATTPCGGSIIGIKTEAAQSSLLTIYPNPFSNQFTINYEPTSTTIVEVFNLLGNRFVNQPIIQKYTLLDLSNQPNGIYVVKVTDGSRVLVKKVVKQ